MDGYRLKTPVVFIIFNRPDKAARVFEQIRVARPPKLLIIADGPRPDRPDDAEKCAAARSVTDGIDWECEVLTNFSETNMGLKRRVSSGLDWVFGQVEEAIVLEDDCLPHPTFFRFCDELLERYRHDERIAMIRGDNWPYSRSDEPYSYRFSIYPGSWGWASWRRVWRNFDLEMARWPAIKESGWLKDWVGSYRAALAWEEIFDASYAGLSNSWAYPMVYSCWRQSQYSVVPNAGLVSNIGGGPDSTHTLDVSHPWFFRKLEAMAFPLKHPEEVIRHIDLDSAGETGFARVELSARRYMFAVLRAVEKLYRIITAEPLRRIASRAFRRHEGP